MERVLSMMIERVDAHAVLTQVVTDQIGRTTVEILTELHDPIRPRTTVELAVRFGVSKQAIHDRARRARQYLDRYGLLPDAWRKEDRRPHP